MKVKKLIELLQSYNQDADITLTNSEDITVSYICKDPNTGKELTPQTTKQCFIEPTDSCPECVHEYMENDIRMCSYYQKHCKNVDECYQYEEVLGVEDD